MITPLDIQQKVFRRSLRGYEMESVDRFIDQLAESYDTLYLEHQSLKEKLDNYDAAIQRYTQMEKSITDTLVLAQKNAGDLQNNTRLEADLLLEEARLKAARIISEAEEQSVQIKLQAREAGKYKVEEAESQVKKTKEEFYFLNKQIQMYRIKFRALLDAQISMLDETGQEFAELMLEKGIDDIINDESAEKADNETNNEYILQADQQVDLELDKEAYQLTDEETAKELDGEFDKSDNDLEWSYTADSLAETLIENNIEDESAADASASNADKTSTNGFTTSNETAAATGSEALKLNFSIEDEDWRMERKRIGR